MYALLETCSNLEQQLMKLNICFGSNDQQSNLEIENRLSMA